MDIKMIVTDLDDTFLRTDKSVSDYTKKIFQACHDKGVKIAFATGRGGSAGRIVPFDFFDGRITQNGAVVTIGGEVVYNRLVPYLSARPLLMACDRRGLKTASQLDDMHYANFNVTAEWDYIKTYEIVYFSTHNRDAEKIYMLVNNLEDETFIKERIPDDLYVSVSRGGMAMVMHKDATKAKATAELARIWDVKQSEIAAFGDDLNDIDMLQYAGVSVAMPNALDEVKAAAGRIADHACDDDGVARWIEASVLKK